ncbi:CoA activase, partial [candidate division GN15 bacterium]|nr:CoA activase [candidate division GN15 bacterium]
IMTPMEQSISSIGIDIGSVSVKVVEVRDQKIERSVYRRFHGGPFEALIEILNTDFAHLAKQPVRLGMTGIGGKTAQSILGGKFFGEISAIARGNFVVAPEVRTVIEMGGEDSKLLILDTRQQTVEDFAMNAQCAAGTGSFLDQQAGRLKISIEDEFGQMALKSKNPPRIAGRCSVFAKSDMIHLQQIATPDYDIVAGLCFAVARNFKSSIARGKKFERPIALEGGVAANPGVVRAFTEILELKPGELVIPEHFNVVGAIGAACLADEAEVQVAGIDATIVESYLKYRKAAESGRQALSFDFPEHKHYDTTKAAPPADIDQLGVYLGIDIGSLSTNLVLIDDKHRVIARRYLMTEGRPIEAVRRGLEEIGEEVGERVIVKAVGTTGSGRYLIGDFVGADIVRNEITAQATAAIDIDPTVDTIFEIGGQDSKYVAIDKQAVTDFEMNKACAAGTGSFLQEQAEKLNIQINTEFGERALCAKCPVGCGERCTVFMESDLVSHQRRGASKNDLLAGLAYSIVSNYLTRVVGDRRIGDNVFFQGGVAWNKAVVAAFEKLLGKRVTVPPHHDVTGAIGAALLAAEARGGKDSFETRFKGFDLHKRRYDVDSFVCEDCSNQCEIHKVEIEGEEPLYYGSRCEKFDVDKKKGKTRLPDYVQRRQRLLFKRYVTPPLSAKSRGRIGIPLALSFYEFYPFWRAFLETAGYKVVNSGKSTQQIVNDALELFVAETCYPIKMVYGHVQHLLKSGKVDAIFMPTLIKTAEETDEDKGAYICPWVQTVGSSVRNRFDFDNGVKFIDAPVNLSYDRDNLRHSLKQLSKQLRLPDRVFRKAVDAGLRAFRLYKRSIREEGQRILDDLGPNERAMVIISRPYNGFDRKLSLELPNKIRDLGFKAIPMDFLPVPENDKDQSFMYWRYGRRILDAADYVRHHKNLFAIYITSFGCGPDSFISHFFRRRMQGKPYLQLELDEHSADAGMVTRCEAFFDSLRFYNHKPPIREFDLTTDEFRPFEKTVYIPNMADHAYAMRAAFERCGLTAEVLDEPDDLTLEYGRRFTSGKECFPCVVTTGDMIKKIHSKDFDRSRAVFFMPGADGPCRFGLYSQFHRVILDELGYQDVAIYSPNSNDGYAQFGLDGTSFRTLAWRGFVVIDGLQKMLFRVRPYEKEKGAAEKLYYQYLGRLDKAILKDESLMDLAEEASEAFSKIERSDQRFPMVGLVGEIYLRHNRFSNNYLIQQLEAQQLEVRLATLTEWPLYTSFTYQHDALKDWDFRGILHSTSQLLLQQRDEHKFMKRFSKHIDIPHDSPVKEVLAPATKYLSLEIKGEAILSIGKAIEMVNDGAAGVVNAMPFNCMPGTAVSSLSKTVSDDLGGVPWLNISYEGLRDSGEETRLEAFAEQVRAFARQRSQGDVYV